MDNDARTAAVRIKNILATVRIKNILFLLYCAMFLIAASVPALMIPFAPGVTEREIGDGAVQNAGIGANRAKTGAAQDSGIGAEQASGIDAQSDSAADERLESVADARLESGIGARQESGIGARQESIIGARLESGAGARQDSATVTRFDFNTHFGFRKELIALDARIKTALFGESPNERVIFGKEGWLYYAETLDPSATANRALDVTAERIARTLALEQEYVNANGARLLFIVAPNKARIYGEFLPYYAPRPGAGGPVLYDLTLRKLGRLGVNHVDLASVMLELKFDNPEILYYHKSDTHWNNLGAAEVYRVIMGEFENMLGDGATADSFVYDTYEQIAPRMERDWHGDLESMLNPLSDKTDIQYYFDIVNEYRTRKPIINLEELNISSSSRKNGIRALFLRDSFANALIQFFSNNLGEAAYSRSLPFPLNRAAGGAYDFVVIEIVERNIGWIVDAAPDIPAALRARHPAGDVAQPLDGIAQPLDGIALPLDGIALPLDGMRQLPAGAVTADIFAPSSGELQGAGIKIAGCFDPSCVPAIGEIRLFPVFESKGGDIFIFEAFPVLEAEMREIAGEYRENNKNDDNKNEPGRDAADCGFSFRINAGELPEGEFSIKMLMVASESRKYISEPLLSYAVARD